MHTGQLPTVIGEKRRPRATIINKNAHLGRWVLRNWASAWHALHPDDPWTVNEIPSGPRAPGRRQTRCRPSRRPGCLPLPLLPGGALSPFATAGRATRRHVKALSHVYRRSSPRPRQPAGLSGAILSPLASAFILSLFIFFPQPFSSKPSNGDGRSPNTNPEH